MSYPPTGPFGPQQPYGVPTGPQFTGPMPTPPNSRSRKAVTIALGATIAVLIVVIAVVATMTIKARNSADQLPTIALQAVGTNIDNPFSPSVERSATAVAPAVLGERTARGVHAVSGTVPGLYGGTGSSSCDAQMLSDYLMNNPGKAQAWAGVFGITTGQIPYYLNTLTPVVLRTDAWVTDHSYSSGRATPFQALLQAGTAVLVDGAGVPRVQCACGNPLGPPASAPLSGYRPTGRVWHHYQPTNVTVVNYNTTNNTTTAPAPAPAPVALQLVNTVTGASFEQVVGNIVSLLGLAPMTGQLPTPAALNVPLRATDDASAHANGLAGAGSTQVAADVAAKAGEPAPNPAADPSAPAAQSPASGASAPATSSVAAAPTQAPAPTVFTGSGDVIGEFAFAASTPIRCTVPITSAADPAPLECDDHLARTVIRASLTKQSVTAATTSDPVWKLTLTGNDGAPQQVAVTSASWVSAPTSTPPSAPATRAPDTAEQTPATSANPSPAPTTEAPPTTAAPSTTTPTTSTPATTESSTAATQSVAPSAN